jgi:hypothetical protein
VLQDILSGSSLFRFTDAGLHLDRLACGEPIRRPAIQLPSARCEIVHLQNVLGWNEIVPYLHTLTHLDVAVVFISEDAGAL